MKATELRIGNYIWDIGDNPQIAIVDSSLFFLWEKNKEVIEPIPLTEQWLKDFGFDVEVNQALSNEFVKDNVVLWSNGEIFYMSYGYESDVNIKHVHQLQNLYFALTGKELTK